MAVHTYNLEDSVTLLESSTDQVPKTKNKLWFDITHPTITDVRFLKKLTGWEKQLIEQITDEDEKPFVEYIGKSTIFLFKIPALDNDGDVSAATMAFIVTQKYIVTIRHNNIEGLHEAISREHHTWMEKTAIKQMVLDIIEVITTSYEHFTEKLEAKSEALEDDLKHLDATLLQKIFQSKKTLTYFARALKANRDILQKLILENDKNLPEHLHFLYLLQDYNQLLDTVETQREVLHSLAEIHQNLISNNLNIAMKKMTVYGSLVLIPTLVASIYGMNFTNMPEFGWEFGYIFAYGLMIVSVLLVYISFKRMKWI